MLESNLNGNRRQTNEAGSFGKRSQMREVDDNENKRR